MPATMVATGGGPDEVVPIVVPEYDYVRAKPRPALVQPKNVPGQAIPVKIQVETLGAKLPDGLLEFFDPNLVFALSDNAGSAVTVCVVESVTIDDEPLAMFTWWVVPTAFTLGHERSLCRFLSERLMEQWRS